MNSFIYNDKLSKINLKENKLTYIRNAEINIQNKSDHFNRNGEVSNLNITSAFAVPINFDSNHTSELKKLDSFSKNTITELKYLEKLHQSKNANMNHFLAYSLERTKKINKQKFVKVINAKDKKMSSFMDNDINSNSKISHDIIQKNIKVSQLLTNQNKSRNFQTIFGKNATLNTDKPLGSEILTMKNNKNVLKDSFVLKTLKTFSNVEYNKTFVNSGIKNQINNVLRKKLNSKVNPCLNINISNTIVKNNTNKAFSNISIID